MIVKKILSHCVVLRVIICMRNKDKVEIYLTAELKQKLKDHCESVGGTMAGVIKKLLKDFLKEK